MKGTTNTLCLLCLSVCLDLHGLVVSTTPHLAGGRAFGLACPPFALRVNLARWRQLPAMSTSLLLPAHRLQLLIWSWLVRAGRPIGWAERPPRKPFVFPTRTGTWMSNPRPRFLIFLLRAETADLVALRRRKIYAGPFNVNCPHQVISHHNFKLFRHHTKKRRKKKKLI